MSFKRKQIKDVFTNLKKLKYYGIYFSGIKGKGEHKTWYDNSQLHIHCFFNEDEEYEGEYKRWHRNGQLWIHRFHISDKKYRGIYKSWDRNGELEKHEIYNDNGSLKEKIV